jgi:hypothetical protein
LQTGGELRGYYAAQPAHLERRRVTKHKYIGVLTAEEGGSNDPETTARPERGRVLLETIAKRVADRAQGLLAQAKR